MTVWQFFAAWLFLLVLWIGLSFAWAWPLDPRPGDTRIGVLHVNVGLMF